MKCPSCGGAELVSGTRDLSYAYQGEQTTIPAVSGLFCPSCGEAVLDAENADRSIRLMREFRAQIGASKAP